MFNGLNNLVFSEDNLFSYNIIAKRRFASTFFAVLFSVVVLSLYYFFFLRSADLLFFSYVERLVNHFVFHMGSGTLLGVFYSSLFGGLFFIFMPTEIVFIGFLRLGISPFVLVPVYILGFLASYTINYFMGMHMINVSKKIVTPKKFYKLKGLINRWGVLAIFAFNALPLPSQPLAAILGVFKYNKTRFYLFFVLGQLVKYVIISLGYIYIPVLTVPV